MSQPMFGSSPNRRRDAHVRWYAERNDVLRAQPLQAEIEVRADEGRVDALGDERLTLAGARNPGEMRCPAYSGARVGTRLHQVISGSGDRTARGCAMHRAVRGRWHPPDRSTGAGQGAGVERLVHCGSGRRTAWSRSICHENPLLPGAGPSCSQKVPGSPIRGGVPIDSTGNGPN